MITVLEKLYKKSEIWFALAFIISYVIGNSFLIQLSESTGLEMVYTIPYNLLLLGILFAFIRKKQLFRYYGINKVRCNAGKLLYYVPLAVIATVNIWFGVRFRMGPSATIVYFAAMIITGFAEEMLFRGLLYKAMSKSSIKSAVIVTSITFGIGHIVNLFNGNNADCAETVCQIFYAVAIGFLLAAVLYAGESLVPCIITHSLLNALSSFSNEAVINKIQIPVSAALCVISAASAILIFKNSNRELQEKYQKWKTQ